MQKFYRWGIFLCHYNLSHCGYVEVKGQKVELRLRDNIVLQDIYDRIDRMDPATFEVRATEILMGLGFSTVRSCARSFYAWCLMFISGEVRRRS